MYQPLNTLTQRQLSRAFALTLVLLLVASALTSVAGRRLRTDASPSGIVNLEVAPSPEVAHAILESWQRADLLQLAAFGVGADYLYILVYGSCLSLGCVWAARQASSRTVVSIGLVLAWLQFVAAALDAVENAALLEMIWGQSSSVWPLLARLCALPKFAFVAAGGLYIATSYAARVWLDAFPRWSGRPI